MPKKESLEHGKRFSYYFTKDFPQEMLDWLNGQSDRNLAFTYALDRLYQEMGNQDLADVLPRNYSPLKNGHAAVGPVEKQNTVPDRAEVRPEKPEEPVEQKKQLPEKEDDSPTVPVQESANDDVEDHDLPQQDPEEEKPKKSTQWGTVNNLAGDPYA